MEAIHLIYALISISIGIPAIIYCLFLLLNYITKDEKAPRNDCSDRILRGCRKQGLA